jgi:uncharacterized protein
VVIFFIEGDLLKTRKEYALPYIFEWNEEKAEENLKKHKVDFNEAKTVFNDPLAITICDPDHSIDEERYIDIGFSSKGRLIVVSYTERGNTVRIISSRKAVKKEWKYHEEE